MALPRRLVAFASAVVIGVACPAVLARTGAQRRQVRLDTDFAVRGVATFRDLGVSQIHHFQFVATDDYDRHIYVAGYGETSAIARFDLLGRPDETFGNGGVAPIPVPGSVWQLSAVGGVVVCGSFAAPEGSGIEGSVGAVRLLPDGSGLDPTFGTDGMLDLGVPDGRPRPVLLSDLARDPRDGSYVALASTDIVQNVAEVGLIRFSRDGVVDPAFGGDGYVEIALSGIGSQPRDLAVDSAGRAIVAIPDGTIRFHADGTRDLTFGHVGVLADADRNTMHISHLAITDGDGIVALGSPANARGGVYRFDAYGDPDETFGRSGRIRLPSRSRGARLGGSAFALVRTGLFGLATGDQVFLAGKVTYPAGNHPEKSHEGWYGELVSDTGARAVSVYTRRNPRPWPEQRAWITDAVPVPHGVVVVGTMEEFTPGGEVDSPFLVKFTFDE